MSKPVTTAEVWLWGSKVGYLYQPEGSKLVQFEYDRDFLRSGIEISPIMMPLSENVYAFNDLADIPAFKGTAGVFADSLPDKFGNQIIRHIAAVLPNTGEHFVKNPMFKFFGTGQLAVDNQPVQVSLGDVGERLGAAGGKGVAFYDTLTVPLQSGAGIGISQGRCRITSTEQIRPVFGQNPHLSKFRAAEYLQIQIFVCRHVIPSFSGQFGGPLTVRWFCSSGEKQKERLFLLEKGSKG